MSRDAASPVPAPSRREIFGWCCFDFANSSFTTVIITVVFGPWFVRKVAEGRDDGEALWGGVLALSQLLVVLLGPPLGALADRTGRKKAFLLASALGCAIPTMLMGFTGAGTVALALALVFVANVCFSLGENFTASFLPELSTPQTCGRISGYGWAFGYFGGLGSLVLALWILKGLGQPPTWAFVATGLFFVVAAIPTFVLLRERAPRRPAPPLGTLFSETLGETLVYLRNLPSNTALFRFFIAFLVFMTGVCAVIAFAGIHAQETFGFDEAGVIKLFIALQLASAAGAFGFGLLQDKFGARPTLVLSLIGWCLTALGSYFAQGQAQFFAVALLAGLVIGSTQSASRAYVSALTPPGREGETFGYWGLFGKLAAVGGSFLFGTLCAHLGLRLGLAFTLCFFIAGLLIFLTLRPPRAKA